MVNRHYIYGVPGVGKSTLAANFAKGHNFHYLELDELRPKVQTLVTKKEEPFIYEYTTEAWKKFGQLNESTAVEGFLAVRTAFQKYIAREISLQRGDFIAEATYVDPHSLLDDDSKITLLITSDEKTHYSHFFVHRPRSDEEDTQFKAARHIQKYLITEAEHLDIQVLDNNSLDLTLAKL